METGLIPGEERAVAVTGDTAIVENFKAHAVLLSWAIVDEEAREGGIGFLKNTATPPHKLAGLVESDAIRGFLDSGAAEKGCGKEGATHAGPLYRPPL